MKTDTIKVYASGQGLEEALEETARFSDYEKLDPKTSLRLSLLAEETLCMVRAITEDFSADFWIENDDKDVVRIHLLAETIMDYYKKQELIAASTKKKNKASKGLMSKIRDIFEDSMYSFNEVNDLQMVYGTAPIVYGNMGMVDVSGMSSLAYLWSMEQYKNTLEELQDSEDQNPEAQEAWDELEKSIIANLADEVTVSVKGDEVEMIVEKKLN